MKALRWVAIVVLALVVAIAMAVVAVVGSSRIQTSQAQDALQPFYTPPSLLPKEPGTVIRMEPLGV